MKIIYFSKAVKQKSQGWKWLGFSWIKLFKWLKEILKITFYYHLLYKNVISIQTYMAIIYCWTT